MKLILTVQSMLLEQTTDKAEFTQLSVTFLSIKIFKNKNSTKLFRSLDFFLDFN